MNGDSLWRIIEALLGAGAIVVPLWWVDRRDRKQQHDENVKRFDLLVSEQRERPAHKHPERSGPLCAENIIYGPRKINGDH